ncbi:hypothetical protein Dimus_014804 [Dionaea muscipula]
MGVNFSCFNVKDYSYSETEPNADRCCFLVTFCNKFKEIIHRTKLHATPSTAVVIIPEADHGSSDQVLDQPNSIHGYNPLHLRRLVILKCNKADASTLTKDQEAAHDPSMKQHSSNQGQWDCGRTHYPLSEDDEDTCATCLEGYSPDNPKILTRCSHHYHLSCIYEWLERSPTCPICSTVMEFNEPEGGRVEKDREGYLNFDQNAR